MYDFENRRRQNQNSDKVEPNVAVLDQLNVSLKATDEEMCIVVFVTIARRDLPSIHGVKVLGKLVHAIACASKWPNDYIFNPHFR